MKTIEEKKARIEYLVKILEEFSVSYYSRGGIRLISDESFNEKYEELEQLENETGYILPNSVTQKIGTDDVTEEKVEHGKQLWSLHKIKTTEELLDFVKKTEQFCNAHNIPPEWIVMWKYDGLTMHVQYKKQLYNLAITRGNGIVGDNKTGQVKASVKSLPSKLPKNMDFDAYGEAYMKKQDFIDYNLANPNNTLNSMRNGCVGVFTCKDLKECAKKNVSLTFYGSFNDELETLSEQIDEIKSLGLDAADYQLAHSYDEIVSIIEQMTKERDDLPFEVDGVVIKLNNLTVYNDMGFGLKYPNGAVAWKFPSKATDTTLLDVEWQIGRTGKITPVGIVSPVLFENISVNRATLNNMQYIRSLGLRIGDTVVLKRANDVIPNISEKIADGNEEIVEPTVCPCCGKPLSKRKLKKGESVDIYCVNTDCEAVNIKAINHFATKKAMNIFGISEDTVKPFFENGLIRHIEDFYSLYERYQEYPLLFECIDKFKEKKIQNLFASIEKSRNVELSQFIYALGIDHVGEKTSIDLANRFKTYQNFLDAKYDDLTSINGIGEIVADSITEFFEIAQDECDEFILNPENFGVNIKEVETIEIDSDNFFYGKTVVITGSFIIPRSELKKRLESKGAKVTGSVSAKTSFLLHGEQGGDESNSSKMKKAMELNIPVLNESETMNKLNA